MKLCKGTKSFETIPTSVLLTDPIDRLCACLLDWDLCPTSQVLREMMQSTLRIGDDSDDFF